MASAINSRWHQVSYSGKLKTEKPEKLSRDHGSLTSNSPIASQINAKSKRVECQACTTLSKLKNT